MDSFLLTHLLVSFYLSSQALTQITINRNNESPTRSVLLSAYSLCLNCIHFQAQWENEKICFHLMHGSADSETYGTFSVCSLLVKSLIKAFDQTVSDIQSITVDKVTLRLHSRFLTDFSVVLFSQCRACWNLQLCDNPQKTCSMSTATKPQKIQ